MMLQIYIQLISWKGFSFRNAHYKDKPAYLSVFNCIGAEISGQYGCMRIFFKILLVINV